MQNLITRDSVVAFIGSHPDDETVIGSLLAWGADNSKELWVLSLTKGEAGWNLDKDYKNKTLAEVRSEEFSKALSILNAKPVMFDYINGMSKAHPEGIAITEPEADAINRWNTKGDKGQTPDGVYARWTREKGDPALKIAGFLDEKRVDIAITMEPVNGFTNHPEHIATAMATLKAVHEFKLKTALYYVYPSKTKEFKGEKISIKTLPGKNSRDYSRVALQSFACYKSQFRIREKLEENSNPLDIGTHLLQKVEIV